VQQHAPPVMLDSFGASARLEIDLHWVHAVNLLVGVAAAVTNRDDQDEKLGMFLGDLRQNLDKIESPILPGVLLRIRQPIEPRLKLVQQKHRRRMPQKLKGELIRRYIGLARTDAFPLTFDVSAMRVAVE
jgi:hypothetical protein